MKVVAALISLLMLLPSCTIVGAVGGGSIAARTNQRRGVVAASAVAGGAIGLYLDLAILAGLAAGVGAAAAWRSCPPGNFCD